jgi:hypothetical protein
MAKSTLSFISPKEKSRKLPLHDDIGCNSEPLTILCHDVYTVLGITKGCSL